jgi:peptidoglycan/LPS O-acetylase OafA/YrhL
LVAQGPEETPAFVASMDHNAVRAAPELLTGATVFIWHCPRQEKIMLGTILIVILVLILLGALPTWPYSSGWGYGPSGGLGLVLVIVLILILLGRL